MPALTHHDVVVHDDAEDLGGGHDLVGHGTVGG